MPLELFKDPMRQYWGYMKSQSKIFEAWPVDLVVRNYFELILRGQVKFISEALLGYFGAFLVLVLRIILLRLLLVQIFCGSPPEFYSPIQVRFLMLCELARVKVLNRYLIYLKPFPNLSSHLTICL